MTQSTIRRHSDSLTTFLIGVSQNQIAAEFVPSAIESLFGDLVFPADIPDRDVAFRLL